MYRVFEILQPYEVTKYEKRGLRFFQTSYEKD